MQCINIKRKLLINVKINMNINVKLEPEHVNKWKGKIMYTKQPYSMFIIIDDGYFRALIWRWLLFIYPKFSHQHCRSQFHLFLSVLPLSGYPPFVVQIFISWTTCVVMMHATMNERIYYTPIKFSEQEHFYITYSRMSLNSMKRFYHLIYFSLSILNLTIYLNILYALLFIFSARIALLKEPVYR